MNTDILLTPTGAPDLHHLLVDCVKTGVPCVCPQVRMKQCQWSRWLSMLRLLHCSRGGGGASIDSLTPNGRVWRVSVSSASSHSTVPKGCMQPKRGTFILLRRAAECTAVTRAVTELWRIHHQRWRLACFGHCLRSPGEREGQTQKSCKLEPTIRSAHSQNSMLSLTSKFC